MLRPAVRQTDGMADFLRHPYLLAGTVDQLEFRLWEKDGQWDTWESSSCAEIQHFRTRPEVDGLGDGQRVQHMMLVEVVDVLPRDDVDLGVPVAVQAVEGLKLCELPVCQLGEVFANEIHHGTYSGLRISCKSVSDSVRSVLPLSYEAIS